MPVTTSGAGRTRTVRTETTEEVPVNESEGQGIGMPWDDFLRQLSDEERELTIVKFYRVEPKGLDEGFIAKLNPALAVDEEWLGAKYGSGTYAAKIVTKLGKSHYERRIVVAPSWGPPKGTPGTQVSTSANAPATPPQPSATDVVLNRFADMLERQNERFERMFENRTQPPAAPATSVAQDSIVSVMAEASKAAIGVVAEAAKTAISASGSTAGASAPGSNFDQDLQRLKLLKEIVGTPTPATPPVNPLEQITGVAAMIKAVREISGDGGGTDWKSALVEKGLDHIPELVDLGKTIMTGRGKEAEEQRKREEARARSLEQIRVLQARQPIAGAPPAQADPAGPSTSTTGGGEEVSPLHVVPIAATPAVPVAEVLPPQQGEEGDVGKIQEFFKRRVVQLVAEGDHPASVLDFIDRADPVIGAILTKASEKQIREFLAKDPVLVEITRLPNYEAFLQGLLQELRADSDEDGEQAAPSAGSPPALKVN